MGYQCRISTAFGLDDPCFGALGLHTQPDNKTNFKDILNVKLCQAYHFPQEYNPVPSTSPDRVELRETDTGHMSEHNLL